MSATQESSMGAASAAATMASKVTYGGSGATALGWLISNEALGVLGLVVALAGLAVNVYFKLRQDKRHQAEHEATMRRLTGDRS